MCVQNATIRLDGRIFVLENLQELCLENIGLNSGRNLELLTNLCRLNQLKTLSLASNGIQEFPVDISFVRVISWCLGGRFDGFSDESAAVGVEQQSVGRAPAATHVFTEFEHIGCQQ